MATMNGGDFTSFRNINARGQVQGSLPGMFRVEANTGGFASTISVNNTYTDQSFAINFPNKSGTMPISGTFAVQLGVVASGYLETMVTVAGIRSEDAFVCQIQNMGGTTVTASTRTYPLIAGARPQNGYVYLTFVNPSGTSTVFSDMVMAYTAMR